MPRKRKAPLSPIPDAPTPTLESPPPSPAPPAYIAGTPADAPRPPQDSRSYTAELGTQIADLFTSGMTLARISTLPGMPSLGSLYRWRRDHADFRQKLDAGKAARAAYFEEKALEAAEMPNGDKEVVPAARLLYDAAVWAAGVNDPTVYGKKTTIQGNPDNPVKIVVLTGVPESEHTRALEMTEGGIVRQVAVEEAHDPSTD